jgi:2-phosphosulfolactate phosphatase
MIRLCEWGINGVMALHARVAVLVIVDVLSFCTAVDVAVARGAIVHPFAFTEPEAAQRAAARLDAALALPRHAAGGQFSLSPVSLLGIRAGTRLVLPSPNGSRLSVAAGRTPAGIPVLAGCLRNAAAVAAAARDMAGSGAIGVIPAGETWPDGSLRPAIEDLLGAGAILDRLGGTCAPEAEVARDAWRSAGEAVARLVRGCVSGRELVDAGFSGDVDLAVDMDVSEAVPRLVDSAFRG